MQVMSEWALCAAHINRERLRNSVEMGIRLPYRPVDPVCNGAVDDARGDAGPEPGGGSGVDELSGYVFAIDAGPFEESAGVVGEGG